MYNKGRVGYGNFLPRYRYILRYIEKIRKVFSDFLHEFKSNLF